MQRILLGNHIRKRTGLRVICSLWSRESIPKLLKCIFVHQFFPIFRQMLDELSPEIGIACQYALICYQFNASKFVVSGELFWEFSADEEFCKIASSYLLTTSDSQNKKHDTVLYAKQLQFILLCANGGRISVIYCSSSFNLKGNRALF